MKEYTVCIFLKKINEKVSMLIYIFLPHFINMLHITIDKARNKFTKYLENGTLHHFITKSQFSIICSSTNVSVEYTTILAILFIGLQTVLLTCCLLLFSIKFKLAKISKKYRNRNYLNLCTSRSSEFLQSLFLQSIKVSATRSCPDKLLLYSMNR